MILEDRGVGVEAFMALQDEAIADARTAHDSIDQLYKILMVHGLGTPYRLAKIVKKLTALGLDLRHPDSRNILNSPFLNRVIHCAVNTVLHDIKHSARIPVPNSYKLVGVADEGPAYVAQGYPDVYTLQEGEIYGENSFEPILSSLLWIGIFSVCSR